MNSSAKKVLVVVEKDTFTASIRTHTHSFTIDEPIEVGGNNLGPDPYEVLLGALGACTAITLRMYAANKGWPLTRISVSLAHQKIYNQDCQNCEQNSARLDNIEKVLYLEGNLSEMQLERLKIIADKCPVHKTLVAGMSITSSLAVPPV
ncbi:OsmC family protein [Rhodocytophaga rosea]|uniref:OsmC family protein n=1 Tax=Rhodocytophaga rosea TaxID=2704465 RepID=A0A6C0GT78_9BACT|nr:OsmC family protein [Rhodocytophaga rosea]QHT71097.1 OsmC family protein [Rhodocytophaga rosea]